MGEPQPRVFGDENLSGVVFRETFMPRARMIGVVLVDASIDGLVQNLTVNGVEVTDYVKGTGPSLSGSAEVAVRRAG